MLDEHPVQPLTTPTDVLTRAIKMVPSVKYALGVAGIGASAVSIKAFSSNVRSTFLMILTMFALMTLLVVFGRVAKLGPNGLRVPAIFLTWTVLLFYVGSGALMVSSVFFKWPEPLPILLDRAFGAGLGSGRPSDWGPALSSISYPVLIRVQDEDTHEPVVNALIYVDRNGREVCPKQMSRLNEPFQCRLPEGDYTFVVSYKGQARTQPVKLRAPGANISIGVPVL
jgi:hypothetical protein